MFKKLRKWYVLNLYKKFDTTANLAYHLYKRWLIINIIGFIISFILYMSFRFNFIKCNDGSILISTFMIMICFIGWSVTSIAGMKDNSRKIK